MLLILALLLITMDFEPKVRATPSPSWTSNYSKIVINHIVISKTKILVIFFIFLLFIVILPIVLSCDSSSCFCSKKIERDDELSLSQYDSNSNKIILRPDEEEEDYQENSTLICAKVVPIY